MTEPKQIEDDPEAMLMVAKLYSKGYRANDVRRYMEHVEIASKPLGGIERRWFDPNEPRWVTK